MTESDWDALRESATAVRDRAYAPYSQFLVGAALLGEDGTIYAGANVENASYGLAQCAERSAIGAAIAAGIRSFRALVVVTGGTSPATPCGMCRQVLSEFPPSFPIRCYTTNGALLTSDVAKLLPHAFGPGNL